ncbi:MAG: hypothetical protein AB7I19_10675 [Planctomycetota bacterium]
MVLLRILSVAALISAAASAQIVLGDVGFQVLGQGGTAGAFCRGFDCRPATLGVLRGETLTITVRAPQGAAYALVAALSASSCTPVPGIWHELALDAPLFPLRAGTVSQSSPILSCYDGFENIALSIPNALPSGSALALQAAAMVGTPIAPNAGTALATPVVIIAR